MKVPSVSVVVTCYNYGHYLAECLDSILRQKTNFDFEIVVSDDCSSDKTSLIIKDYARNYPRLIKPIIRDRNLGMVQNAVQTIEACTGEYVALMEGDDIWVDENKLQSQVNFLDTHLDCVFCFTNQTTFVDDKSNESNPLYNATDRPPEIFDLEYFIRTNLVIPNNTKMFRRAAQPLFFEPWFYNSVQWDWVLHILQAQKGNIGYLDNITLGYRRHAAAAVMPQNGIKLGKSGLETLKGLNKSLNYKFDYRFSRVAWHYNFLAFAYLEKRMIFSFLYNYFLFLTSLKSVREFKPKDDLWKLRQIIRGKS